ncbi:MAG: VWA domain-containing protein [Opitutaceae bacterium]|nr:VWA domain-containing protein [Opitutaceae bacterium]
MDEFVLLDPWWLAALTALPVIAALRGRRAASAIVLPFAGNWQRSAFGNGSKLSSFFAFVGAALIIVSLARPQALDFERQTKSKGYDIMLVLDLSSSMLYEDYKDGFKRINRLQAVKPVLSAFIEKRENDRIGLVAFAGQAYTVAPLTFDHKWLSSQTNRLGIGLIEDGTAIGDAIGVAISRLQEGAKKRSGEREGAFAILLTDGAQTAGAIEPIAAAELSADYGIPIYTIGAGRDGMVIAPRMNAKGERIGSVQVPSGTDEPTLKEMARVTGGEFHRADNTDTIQNAFDSIDEQSKIEFESHQYSITTELFPYSSIAAGAMLFLSLGIGALNRKETLS